MLEISGQAAQAAPTPATALAAMNRKSRLVPPSGACTPIGLGCAVSAMIPLSFPTPDPRRNRTFTKQNKAAAEAILLNGCGYATSCRTNTRQASDAARALRARHTPECRRHPAPRRLLGRGGRFDRAV